MPDLSRRGALGAAGAAGAAGVLGLDGASEDAAAVPAPGAGAAGGGLDATGHRAAPSVGGLVGTWACSHHAPVDDLSAEGLEDQTIRQNLHTSVGGEAVRLRLSNQFGEDTLRVGRAAVGLRADDMGIDQDTVTELTFGGRSGVSVPPGARAYSDPAPLSVPADADVTVDLYVPLATGPTSWHNYGKDESFVASGDAVGSGGNAFSIGPGESYFFVDGLDVVAPETTGTVVCLGDSITDGARAVEGSNDVYPTFLARRIEASSVVQKSVVNQGMNGNRLLHNAPADIKAFGPAGVTRLDRDVLAQTAVTDVIVLLGVNDILHAHYGIAPDEPVTARGMIDALEGILGRCHAAGVRAHGGTIMPLWGAVQEQRLEDKRRAVNDWIRTGGRFDGVVDFDAAVRNPDDPKRIQDRFVSDDGLHPSRQGYQAMAAAVDLGLLASDEARDGDGTTTGPGTTRPSTTTPPDDGSGDCPGDGASGDGGEGGIGDGSGVRFDFGPIDVTIDW